MKFTVHLKDPDGFHQSIEDVIMTTFSQEGLTDRQIADICDDKHDEVILSIKKWVRYSECISIEFDTELGTATVLPAGR